MFRRRSRSLLSCLACLSALATSCSKPGPAVYLDLPLAQALQLAEAEGKAVLLVFGASWCGPCKKLAATTMVDPQVEAWLREKTVPLYADIDEDPTLAAEFAVRGVPALVFLRPDKSVLGTISGYRAPAELLEEAGRRLQGISAVDEKAAKVKEKPADLMARLEHFEELLRAGRDQQAMEAAEFYWQQSRGVAEQTGVRTSFFLASMMRLSQRHPPAGKMMERWLSDAIAAAAADDEDALVALGELIGLARTMQRPEPVLQLAERSKGMGLRMIVLMGGELLLQAQRYQLIVDSGLCTPKAVKDRLRMESFMFASRGEGAAKFGDSGERSIASAVMMPFEALVGVGREEDAMEVAKLALGGAGDFALRTSLADVAMRMGREGLAKQIRDGR